MFLKPLRTITTAATFATIQSSLGAISFTENFDDKVTGANLVSNFRGGISEWGESANNNFNEFIGNNSSGGGPGNQFSPAGGSGATPGINSGYLYTELGSLGTDFLLTISGDNYRRGGNVQFGTLLLEVFSLPAGDSFTFAEFGNDIATAVGVSNVGSFSAANTAANNASTPFSQTLDLSGVAGDARLFLRISRPIGTNGPAYVDNLSVVSSIPEPSVFGLLLLGAGFGLRRRR